MHFKSRGFLFMSANDLGAQKMLCGRQKKYIRVLGDTEHKMTETSTKLLNIHCFR